MVADTDLMPPYPSPSPSPLPAPPSYFLFKEYENKKSIFKEEWIKKKLLLKEDMF